jgi:hypothetical protein
VSSSISCNFLSYSSLSTRTVDHPLSAVFSQFLQRSRPTRSKSERWIIGPSQQTRNLEPGRWFFVGDSNTSALAEHALNTGVTIGWDHATVLDSCQQLSQRLVLESWYVYKQPAPLNQECGPLPPVYHALVEQWSSCIPSTHSSSIVVVILWGWHLSKCRNYSFLARDQGCQELLLVFLATQASIVKERRCCANGTTIGHISHTCSVT